MVAQLALSALAGLSVWAMSGERWFGLYIALGWMAGDALHALRRRLS